jgi:hypothetical protein
MTYWLVCINCVEIRFCDKLVVIFSRKHHHNHHYIPCGTLLSDQSQLISIILLSLFRYLIFSWIVSGTPSVFLCRVLFTKFVALRLIQDKHESSPPSTSTPSAIHSPQGVKYIIYEYHIYFMYTISICTYIYLYIYINI